MSGFPNVSSISVSQLKMLTCIHSVFILAHLMHYASVRNGLMAAEEYLLLLKNLQSAMESASIASFPVFISHALSSLNVLLQSLPADIIRV